MITHGKNVEKSIILLHYKYIYLFIKHLYNNDLHNHKFYLLDWQSQNSQYIHSLIIFRFAETI